jgi:hypothetical protein
MGTSVGRIVPKAEAGQRGFEQVRGLDSLPEFLLLVNQLGRNLNLPLTQLHVVFAISLRCGINFLKEKLGNNRIAASL